MAINKKASLSYETVTWIIGTIVIGIGIFFSFSIVNEASDKAETVFTNKQGSIGKDKTPLYSKFPLTYVHSFLMLEISKEDLNKLNLKNQPYYIKDLIWIDTSETNEIIEKYRKNYNELLTKDKDGKSIHEGFKNYYLEDYDEEELIIIKTSNTIPDLEDSIKRNDYFFIIKTQHDTNKIIYFRNVDNYIGVIPAKDDKEDERTAA